MTERPVTAASGVGKTKATLVIVLLVALAALAVRVVGIGFPASGYHVFNEGFYSSLATANMDRSVFAWLLEPGDLNNPPLYSLVVSSLFGLLGPSLVIARLVSVVAGAATAVFTFLLGRELFGEKTGLAAAACLAVLPGAVLITHNAQVDALLVMLEVSSVYYYVTAATRGSVRRAAVSGVLLGLALLTKLPAVLTIPAMVLWEIGRVRGLSWLKERRLWCFVGCFLAVGLSWHVLQLALHGNTYLAAQAGIGSSYALPNAEFWRSYFLRELAWMHWPPLFVAVVAAVVYSVRKHTASDMLVLTAIAANLVFYTFFHFHSYYLLPIAPFTVLLAARAAEALFERLPKARLATYATLLSCLLVAALVMLAGHKIGLFSPAYVELAIGADSQDADLWLDEAMTVNFLPVVEFYTPGMRVRPADPAVAVPRKEDLARERRSFLLAVKGPDEAFVAELVEWRHELVLFGVGIGQCPPNEHLMANGRWNIRWGAHPAWTFGILPLDEYSPGPRLYDLDALYAAGPVS